jgi:hypothetical protein
LALLIVILGLLLSAGGAFFIILGFDIVMTDRGAAMTTSGTIALSSGIVTLAIGLALRRLTQILRVLTLREPSKPAADVRAGQQSDPGGAPDPAPAHHLMPSTADPAAAQGASAQRTAAAAAGVAAVGAGALIANAVVRAAKPDPLTPPLPASEPAAFGSADPAARSFPQPDHGRAEPMADGDAPAADERSSDAMTELDRILGFAPEEPPVISDDDLANAPMVAEAAPAGGDLPDDMIDARSDAAAEADEGAPRGDAREGDLEFLLKGEEAADPIEPPHPDDDFLNDAHPAGEADDGPDRDDGAEGDEPSPAAPAHRPEHADDSRVEAMAALPEAAAMRPMVLGSYKAGGRVYTMFADGSVEAVTEHGVERFASMEALRAHLART